MGLPKTVTDTVHRNYNAYVAPILSALAHPPATPAAKATPRGPSTGQRFSAPTATRRPDLRSSATARDAARASDGLRREQIAAKAGFAKLASPAIKALPKFNPAADQVTDAMVGVLDKMQAEVKDDMVQGRRRSELATAGFFDSGNIVCSSWANEWEVEGRKPGQAVNEANVQQLVTRTNAALEGTGVTVTGVTPHHIINEDSWGHHWVNFDVQYANGKGGVGTLHIKSQTNGMGMFNDSKRND